MYFCGTNLWILTAIARAPAEEEEEKRSTDYTD
jgi:hypothetical protein